MPSAEALLDMLSEAARSLNRHRDLNELLHAVVDLCLEAVQADTCFVYLYEEGDLVLRATSNAHPDEVGRLRMRIGEGITGWVAQQRRPVALAEKATTDARFKFYSILPEDSFEAFLSVPILFRDRVLGVMNLQHREVHEHTPVEIRAVQALGWMLGEALERTTEAAARQQFERRIAAAAQFQRWLLSAVGAPWPEACERLAAALEARAVAVTLNTGSEPQRLSWSTPDAPALETITTVPEPGAAPARTGRSTWLLPLAAGAVPIGSLQILFTLSGNADLTLAVLLGGLLAAAVHTEALRAQADQQQRALAERKLVERAKALLQREKHLSEADAYHLLQQESRRTRRSMAAIAQDLLDAEAKPH